MTRQVTGHPPDRDRCASEANSVYTLIGGFADAHLEADFRRTHLGWFNGRLITAGLLGGILYCVALSYDHAVLGNSRAFQFLLADRLTVLISGLWLALHAYRNGRRQLSLPVFSMLVFELILASGFLGVVFLHGGSIVFHTMSMLAIVTVFYIFLPNLSTGQLLIPWLFSLAFLVIFRLVFEATSIELTIPALLLLLSNLLGTFFVRLINRGQRSEYATVQALQLLNAELRQEIADRKLIEDRLRASEDNLQHLFDVAPVPLVLTRDRDGAILRLNRAASLLLRVEAGQAANLRTPDFYVDLREREDVITRLRTQGLVEGADVHLRTNDGKPIETLLTAVRTEFDGETVYFVGLVDISERKRIERELQRLASTDALTGLHNRRSFFELAEREIRRARRKHAPLCLLLLDVDEFKQINDRFGHAVGDNALNSVVRAISACLREYDIPARIGGEEFAILLPEVALEAGIEAAERLREAVAAASVVTPGGPITLTVSIGVAVVDGDAGTIDRALSQADGALYEAKRAGRNRVAQAGDERLN
ncbi:hypothetical protein BI364_03260 [Acidihalobacter yilgarnensis]|uniref:diguanylate cyclase n=1 Tax=Acidihalobacter yilgarnensis TaxID=2819280 RepID=A0A1D8IL81_9GAMM|nr:sensor domain-containing diguanylate cyclase [Acidihalobacter yilgarnensis]AOU97151.1 hypothetical protein BI364_03260 [Acidihalobacter yilgarnensis]